MGLTDTHADRQRSASTRANPDLVYVAALGHAWGPNAERGVFRSKDGGADVGEGPLRASERGRDRPVDRPEQPAHPLRGVLGGQRYPARAALSGGPGSGIYRVDRWRRHVDGAHAQAGAAEGRAGQDRAGRIAGAGRTASGRWSRPRTARSSAPTTAARPGSALSERARPAPACLVLHARLRRPAGRRHRLGAELRNAGSRSTAARRSSPCRRRTATITICGSTRVIRSRMIKGNDGGACVTFNGGAVLVDDLQPADGAVLSRDHRQSGAVPGLRLAAGQHRPRRPEPRRRVARSRETDWYRAGRRRERLHRRQAGRSETSSSAARSAPAPATAA